MAAILPPIVPSPFGKYFDRKPYIFTDSSNVRHAPTNDSSSSLLSAYSEKRRRVSPISGVSLVSTSLGHPSGNNENRTKTDVLNCSLKPRKSPTTSAEENFDGSSIQGLEGKSNQARVRSADNPRADFYFPPQISTKPELNAPANRSHVVALPVTDFETKRVFNNVIDTPEKMLDRKGELPTHLGDIRTDSKDIGHFKKWANTFRRRQGSITKTPFMLSRQPPRIFEKLATTSSAHAQPLRRLGHRKRFSNASSGFVETLKTASLSNNSFNMLPGSHRQSRSDDTRMNRGSFVRMSAESDRHLIRTSFDEAAVYRGFRRYLILQELVASEESYIADLNALVNVFSTLLASINSISVRARSNMQRNLLEILQIHTAMLKELSKATLTVESHMRKAVRYFGRSPKRFKLDSHIQTKLDRQPNHSRISTDSANHHAVSGITEPHEAAEAARIFRKFMTRFFAYEEYCSNHEIVVCELAASQRSVVSWPSFEMGSEALARSVRAIDLRSGTDKKALTITDLLISPIQRVTKYPLLLADLLRNTPVIDCPTSHAEIEATLQQLRDILKEVNHSTDDPLAREQIRRRWILHERLLFNDETPHSTQFRMLGHAILCGVLHLAYQTKERIQGGYGLCILFVTHLVLTVPAKEVGKFMVIACINISDLKVESPSDGKGLQCHTALFSWKIAFEADHQIFEIILSACSGVEQEQWTGYMDGRKTLSSENTSVVNSTSREPFTAVVSDLKPVGVAFSQTGTLARRLSIQRAATIGNRAQTCQVIIRNTHKPLESHGPHISFTTSVSRSQSLLTTQKVVVLAPKRSERIRLENSLADVWTRDKLPFPGMTGSRGGQIIRASAGSLVRKLSLASMHTPFARRSGSLTMTSPRAIEVFQELKQEPKQAINPEEISVADTNKASGELSISEDAREMSEKQSTSPIIQDQPERMSFTGVEKLLRRGTRKGQRQMSMVDGVPPEEKLEARDEKDIVAEKLAGGKKRWSNPIGLLKSLSTEGVRNMLYSSR